MSKIKLAVIFGGMSSEHSVSIVSGTSVIKNLNKEKYDILPLYIKKDGNWFKYKKPICEIEILNIGDEITEIEKIDNPIEMLKSVDIIFPVLHGLYGEDGTIQGLFELLNKKYVGCKVLSSSICMDKAYAKIIFDKAGIEQADYLYIKKKKQNYICVYKNFNEKECTLEEICEIVKEKIGYPVFIKPSNSGSSVGINKSHNDEELMQHITYAARFDKKILIEQNVVGREVECAVLGNESPKVSCVGEILPAEEFYTFDAKYKNAESRVVIPAELPKEVSKNVREAAIKAYKAADCKGLSRVDFFVEKDTNKIIINEINTLPGFTQISMYPKLLENEGISYSELLDKLIELALEE